MAEKRDFMSECNDLGVSAQDFEAQFCFRCLQPECARSQHGKSRFEARIGTWEQRLFQNVPTMPESDPRFVVLHAKKFVEIDSGRIPEIGRSSGAWIDPRDLDVAQKSPQSTSSSEQPAVPVTSAAPPPVQETTPEVPRPTHLDGPPAMRRSNPGTAPLMNTPVQQGRMIGGFEPAPPRDPWDAKAPTETKGIPVVKPGARIKISGSGV